MKLTKENFQKAKNFILTNGRMIERRLFEYHFVNGNKMGVYHAVFTYRNLDGGFGHGMEPDTASPESQPLFTIMALEKLDEIRFLNQEFILKYFVPYFESILSDQGGIPWMFRPKSDYPCADHFKTLKERPAISTTAPLIGILKKYDIRLPWMDKAEKFIWSEIERLKDKHVNCQFCIPRRLTFLNHAKDRIKANEALDNLKVWIMKKGVICTDKSDPGWGLYEKPHSLNFAESPNSILSSLFTEEMINEDLDELIGRQKDDGRWDTWYGLSEGMKLEWAGMQTLWTLKTLKSYDRIEAN